MIELGKHRFWDFSDQTWHALPDRARSVYKSQPPATFIPDAHERFVIWGTMTIQDCRQHFRSRRALPGEAELNRVMRASGHDLWRREEACLRCRWSEGTGHEAGGRIRELHDGSRLRTCGVMESSLAHVVFELDVLTGDVGQS